MNENNTAVPNNQMAVISIVSAAIAWILGGLGSCAAILSRAGSIMYWRHLFNRQYCGRRHRAYGA